MGNSIYDSEIIFNSIVRLGLEKSYRRTVLRHIMSIIVAVFISGYKGKTVQISKSSNVHRTTVAHFLNDGKWKEDVLEQVLKRNVIETIYAEAKRTGKAVYCIVGDTIASKTKGPA